VNWDLGYSCSSSGIYRREDFDMNEKLKYQLCSNPLVLCRANTCRVNTCGLTTCIYSSAISANTMSWNHTYSKTNIISETVLDTMFAGILFPISQNSRKTL
jgi:hypothetical protein